MRGQGLEIAGLFMVYAQTPRILVGPAAEY